MGDTRGGLEKLTITAFADPGYGKRADTTPNPLKVMINPSQYSQAMGINYTQQQGAGGTGKTIAFNRDQGEALDLTLVFDGTGTVPDAPTKSVPDQLADLKRLIYDVNWDIRSPNFVQLSWGTLLFKGRLKTLGIEYTLFDADGTPLRAKVKAAFLGYHENSDARKGQHGESAELSQIVEVEAGDSLPNLCKQVYGDEKYYLAVARHNGLDDFRALTPPLTLLFPPLAPVSAKS
ncbi:hypothetical protein LQ953_09175 [Sphingomonas sp. IC-56]|uniref:CIS tube protein n=1 Tax=Sphingomonas sp. IC-56 TaxID=2898529 RepID=UPI001E63A969|nr:hypothetical protein [Sphingomonas sp. IC-56]MCD2324181.1 hypothetical protein [Sphingomonas sp. IC-56]